jgi:hypothetical protein
MSLERTVCIILGLISSKFCELFSKWSQCWAFLQKAASFLPCTSYTWGEFSSSSCWARSCFALLSYMLKNVVELSLFQEHVEILIRAFL